MPLNPPPPKAQISIQRGCRGLSQQILGLNLSSLVLSKPGTILLKSLPRMGGYMKDCPQSSGATVLQRASQSYPKDQTYCRWGQQTWKLRPDIASGPMCLHATRPAWTGPCVKQLRVMPKAGLPTWDIPCAGDHPSTRSRQLL